MIALLGGLAASAFLVQLLIPGELITLSVIASAFLMGTQVDFESLAKRYIEAGFPASSSASVVGASGIRHQFAFAVTSGKAIPDVVVDTALSVTEVEETKVLAFFAKVYDVRPKAAILCVSPRLNSGAAELARQYAITVLEHERPRELMPMLSRAIDEILGIG